MSFHLGDGSTAKVDPRHRSLWILIGLVTGGALFWTFDGRGLLRRALWPPATVEGPARAGAEFIALVFPKITREAERFTMSQRDFEAVLDGLGRLGFTSVGLRELDDFYLRGRPLPPKAVLIALDRDAPGSVRLADRAMRRQRMRGVVFLNKTTAEGNSAVYRQALTPHAVNQLLKSGSWEFGLTADAEPGPDSAPPGSAAFDSGEPKHEWMRAPRRFRVRFAAGKSGYNDSSRGLHALAIARVRGDHTADENLRLISAQWPRRLAFFDDFELRGLGLDWVSDWGVISVAQGRLALIPTPRQKSASVFLGGTDDWTDLELEFTLKKYQKDFWAYARASGDRFVRVGARDGHWLVQQKLGPRHKPVTLGREPMRLEPLPAKVRLVVKGRWAIVFVNDRMRFGKALKLHPGVDRGRVQFGVLGPKPKEAIAVLEDMRAAPLTERWLAVERSTSPFEVGLADLIRGEAAAAQVLSPRWFDDAGDRELWSEPERDLLRALAGYYRCRFVPMLDLSAPGALPRDPGAAERLAARVIAALSRESADGLNLRLELDRADPQRAAFVVAKLRQRLKPHRWGLWVTLTGSGRESPLWSAEIDGLLRAVDSPVPGAERLELSRKL